MTWRSCWIDSRQGAPPQPSSAPRMPDRLRPRPPSRRMLTLPQDARARACDRDIKALAKVGELELGRRREALAPGHEDSASSRRPSPRPRAQTAEDRRLPDQARDRPGRVQGLHGFWGYDDRGTRGRASSMDAAGGDRLKSPSVSQMEEYANLCAALRVPRRDRPLDGARGGDGEQHRAG